MAALETAGTLYGYAASLPDPIRLQGRGVVYGIEAPGGRWVVRRYRRGGLVARWLGPACEPGREWFARLWASVRPAVAGRTAQTPRIWST